MSKSLTIHTTNSKGGPDTLILINTPCPGIFFIQETPHYRGFNGISLFVHIISGSKKIYFDPKRWPPYNVIIDTFNHHKHYDFIAIIGVLLYLKDGEARKKID